MFRAVDIQCIEDSFYVSFYPWPQAANSPFGQNLLAK